MHSLIGRQYKPFIRKDSHSKYITYSSLQGRIKSIIFVKSLPEETSTSQELSSATTSNSGNIYGSPVPSPPPDSSSGKVLAGGAVAAAVMFFAATRLLSSEVTLASLEEKSIPFEMALSNGRPTVLEFYANWCEVCKEMVPVEFAVEEKYASNVNFVMLNIENTRWAPEVAEYGVNGIPHFVFLNQEGKVEAAAIGRLPKEVLEGNVDALAQGRALPYARTQGATSSLMPPQGSMAGPRQANPRDHA